MVISGRCAPHPLYTLTSTMSQLVLLPANHAKHRMPWPFDKLYYLDLALPNDDDTELVSPPAPNTFSFNWFPHLARLLQHPISCNVRVPPWRQGITTRERPQGLAHQIADHHTHRRHFTPCWPRSPGGDERFQWRSTQMYATRDPASAVFSLLGPYQISAQWVNSVPVCYCSEFIDIALKIRSLAPVCISR